MEWETNINTREFYKRTPTIVARELLGMYLVRRWQDEVLVGKIIETEEAYLSSQDEASHGYKPESSRTKSLFGEAGYSYVTNIHHYFIMNVVTEGIGLPSGVLVRAVEPVLGIETMKKLRGIDNVYNLTNGPGKLCIAFGINRSHDGIDITDSKSEIFIAQDTKRDNLTDREKIVVSPRIGISTARELPLRFYLNDNIHVSGKRIRIPKK